MPDMIPRLDASIPLIEQVNKLPYDKRWEFPRELLHFGKSWLTLMSASEKKLWCLARHVIKFTKKNLKFDTGVWLKELFADVLDTAVAVAFFR